MDTSFNRMNDDCDDLNITWLLFYQQQLLLRSVINTIINIELIEICLFKWPIIR